MLDWVHDSAKAVAGYYGRFPVDEPAARGHAEAGRGISGGRTWAHDGALIRIRVGEASMRTTMKNDWVLVHEMTHLALPSLPDAHEWLEEGLATYVESIARAQAGQLSVEQVWAGFVEGMPNGLPQPGDRGLDRTHTWGRTYWGGALFCLLADLEIRRRTENRLGLQDALRAILASGNMETESELEPLLEIGDRAVGVPVLSELYGRMKDQPAPTDLRGALAAARSRAPGPKRCASSRTRPRRLFVARSPRQKRKAEGWVATPAVSRLHAVPPSPLPSAAFPP